MENIKDFRFSFFLRMKSITFWNHVFADTCVCMAHVCYVPYRIQVEIKPVAFSISWECLCPVCFV